MHRPVSCTQTENMMLGRGHQNHAVEPCAREVHLYVNIVLWSYIGMLVPTAVNDLLYWQYEIHKRNHRWLSLGTVVVRLSSRHIVWNCCYIAEYT